MGAISGDNESLIQALGLGPLCIQLGGTISGDGSTVAPGIRRPRGRRGGRAGFGTGGAGAVLRRAQASTFWSMLGPSFNNLIGARQQRRRDRQAESLRRLEVDDQLKPSRLLHG